MMSKIGRKSITIPKGISASIDHNVVTISKGTNTIVYNVPIYLSAELLNDELTISINNDSAPKKQQAMFGTTRQHINNIIIGLDKGFKKELIIHGIGFEVADEQSSIALRLGFSHTINWIKKSELNYKVDNKNKLTISGQDKYAVHQEAANIRALRKHSVYQKFGVKYSDEVIVFKSVDTRRNKMAPKK